MRYWRCMLLVFLLVSFSAAAQAPAGLTLQQLARLQNTGQAVISPDGGHIAYTRVVPRELGGTSDGPAYTELHVVDRDGNSRAFVTGQGNVGGLAWFPDGRSIAFLSKRSGDDTRSLYRIALDGGEAAKIASLASDIGSYSLSPDGRQAALVALQTESEELKALRRQGFTQKIYEEDWRPFELWIKSLNENDGDATHLGIEGSVQSVLWSPAGDRLALTVAPRQLTDDTLVFTKVRIVGTDGRVIGLVDNPGKLGQLAWSTDGNHLAIISAADVNDPSEGRLTVVGAAGGVQRDLLPGLEGHVRAVAWKDPSTLLFISHEGVESRLARIDVDGGGQRDLLPLGGPIWTNFSLSENGEIALSGHTSTHPPEVFLLPSGGGEAIRLTDSNPWLSSVALARQEVVRYTARDGLELEGLLVHPLERRGNGRVPLILVVHGGPESHYSNGWLTSYANPAHHAAAQGYALFYPNYRASTGRGVEFSKLDHGRPGMEEFDDLVDGVDHLIDIGLVDRDRVGITGGSYGGYASGWGATYYSERFAASVMFVGISDQASLVTTGDIPWEQYLVHMQTWPWESPEMFRNASPINHAANSRTPTLILHGEADPRVPVSQSYMMYRYLQLAGQAPVRLVLYPGEGHGNARTGSRYDYSLRLMQWMDHYLRGAGGEPPPYEIDYALPTP